MAPPRWQPRRAPPPPPGWSGKAWACHVGAQQTDGDFLLFLDADTVLAPGAVGRLLDAHDGGLLSVQPWHRCGRPSESLSAMFNLVSMMGTGAFAGLPGARSSTAAYGPVILCRRADYLAAGGHAGVRGDVVEDVALAHRFRDDGQPVRCRTGRGTVEFRMYPHGLRQLAEGWTKNIAEGARSATRPWALVLTVWWVAALVVVATDAVVHPGLVTLAAYGAVVGQLAWLLHRVGRFAWWAWALWPVPLIAFLAVFARSLALRLLGRPVSWKGRAIPVR
jgi:4,4'-diaponeurosporenoate glycosyltransferase